MSTPPYVTPVPALIPRALVVECDGTVQRFTTNKRLWGARPIIECDPDNADPVLLAFDETDDGLTPTDIVVSSPAATEVAAISSLSPTRPPHDLTKSMNAYWKCNGEQFQLERLLVKGPAGNIVRLQYVRRGQGALP